MGLILTVAVGILATIGAILIAVVSKVLTDDVKAWLPWITQRLLDTSIRRLPEAERERYSEEWFGHIHEVPGDLTKLFVAWGYLSASRAIGASVEPSQRLISRSAEVIVASGLIVLLLPAIVTTVLLIRLDRGPVFSTQMEVGRNGKPFLRFKFRTTSNTLNELDVDNAEWGGRRMTCEPRVTRVGQFLLVSSFDEWPLLINVLRGDVTLGRLIKELKTQKHR